MAVTAPAVHPEGVEPAVVRERTSSAGAVLAFLLLAALTFAVFAHGATNYPAEARVQVALAAAAIVACALWLFVPGRRIAAPPGAWIGLGLMAAFAAWSGLSLAWTVAASGTWVELNRAITYTLVVALALAAGSWSERTVARVAWGYLALALAVALYALGGKIAPAVHIGDLVHLDQTRNFARLRAPLQYWNALALFCVMAVPIALRLAVEELRPRVVRLGGLAALAVLLVTIGLTYSRGGVVAVIVAIGLTVALAGDARLRTLMYLAVALAAVAAPLAVGFGTHDLTQNGLVVSKREHAGVVFGLVLLGSLVALLVVGRLVMAAESRVAPNPVRSRWIARGLAAALGVVAVAGVVALATSDRGLTGTISHQWDVFRTPKASKQFDPARLLTTNSGNRWVWWSEAVGAWSDHPIEGSGAGSFPVLHREYRTNRLDVLQPHSVPLQFLAETGLVGALLALGGLALLLAAAVGGVRRLVPGPERGAAAGLCAASLVWLFHGLYEWDWDIPGVTMPALLFMGVLAARPLQARAPRPPRLEQGTRALALAGATLVICTVAISAALPSWAQTKSQNALAELPRNPSDAQLGHAEAQARLAARLDTLSSEPLLNAAAIAGRRHHPLAARGYLLQAVGREPSNARVWLSLAIVEFQRGDLINVGIALDRISRLDPRNLGALVLAATRGQVDSPANDSATAIGTPLLAIVPGAPAPGTTTGAAAGTTAGAGAAATTGSTGALIPATPGSTGTP